MKVNLDTILDVLEPLSGPRLSPAVLAVLAYAVRPGEVGDALWQLRHGRSVVHGQPLALHRRLGDLLRAIVEALFRSNAWLRVWTVVSIVRYVNRVGARLLIDRAPQRTIVWRKHLVVITGGARGIGGRTCELLKQKGAAVVVIDRAPHSAHKKEDLYISADVTNEEDMLKARQTVHRELGYPTMLVSAAGIARHSFVLDPPHRFSSEYANAVVDINLKGSFVFARVFGQDLLSEYDEEADKTLIKSGKATARSQPRKEGTWPIRNNFGGHILLIGSGAAFVPCVYLSGRLPSKGGHADHPYPHSLPANAGYNSSKAGIVSLHHTLNFELDVWHKSNTVRNSVFCPLMIDSAMTQGRMKEQRNQFLFPTLNVDQAARKIIKVLEEDRSQVFFAPRACYALSLLSPNAPPWVVRLIAKATGAHETFTTYCAATRLAVNEH